MNRINRFLSMILCAVLLSTCICGVGYADTSYSNSEKLQKVNTWCSALEKLFDQCDSLGITSVYDNADYEIVKHFSERMATETDQTKFDYYFDVLAQIYDSVRTNLITYINGSGSPLIVDKKDYSNIKLKDGDLYSVTEQGGVAVYKPIVTGGYHYWQSTEDYAALSAKLGSTATEGFEYQQWDIVAFNSTDGSLTKSSSADAEIKMITDLLDMCEELNICVSFTFGASAYRPWGFDKYYNGDQIPEEEKLTNADASYSNYINCNPTHPAFEELYDMQASILLPPLQKYRCITSIMLVNEPTFEANDKPYYYDEWTQYITNLYGNISALNSAYGTSYSSFDEVKMPLEAELTPLYYDYREFTTDILKEYFTNLKNSVKKYLPDIPVGVKLMEYTRALPTANGSWNIKYDKYKDILDVNYNDSFAFVDSETLNIPGKMLWYDYLRSVIKAPVINGENHIIEDKWNGTLDINYDSRIPKHVAADMWQGAIHGSDQTVNWLLSDNERTNNTYPNATALYRPDLMSEVSKTTLDMERLSDEITAISNAECDTAILYSDTTWNYNKSFTENNYKAYLAAIYSGHKVEFVTERTLDNLGSQKVLIVPCISNTTAETVQKINAFVNGGGKVLFVGSDCLKKDRNNKSFSEDILNTVNDLYAASVTVGNISELSDSLYYMYEKMGMNVVTVIDDSTGRRVSDTEWNTAIINDEYFVNICNYGETAKSNVSVYVNGKKADLMLDMRREKSYHDSLTLETNVPLLLKVVSLGGEETYEPKNVVAVHNSSSTDTESIGINVSWVNPNAQTLRKVSIYEHGDDGTDTLLNGSIDSTPGKVCEYRHIGLGDGEFKTYKIEFEFSDRSPVVVYTSGDAGKGEYMHLISNVKNPDVTFSQRFGILYADGGLIPGIINKVVAEGNNQYLDFRANVVENSDTKAYILFEFDSAMVANQMHTLTFKYKSATHVTCDVYIGTMESGNKKSTMTIPASDEWTEFSHTFYGNWTAPKLFLEFYSSVEQLCIDDIKFFQADNPKNVMAARDFEYQNMACTKGPNKVEATADVNSAIIAITNSDDWYISSENSPDCVQRVVNYYNIYEVENGTRTLRAKLARAKYDSSVPTLKLENLKGGKNYLFEVTCEDNAGVYESAAYAVEVTPNEPYTVSDFIMTNSDGTADNILFDKKKYTASVQLANNSAQTTAYLIVGLYSDDALANIYITPKYTIENSQSKTLSIENIDLSSLSGTDVYIKCFLFKDLSCIDPLRLSKKYTVIN